MAKITDPDSLVAGNQAALGTSANVLIDPVYRMVHLAEFGDLVEADGVTMQAFYSFLKEEWKDTAELLKYTFPMVAITPEQFEFIANWQPADMPTVYMFKDGGFAVKDNAGASSSEFAGIITLGTLGATDQVYYLQEDHEYSIAKNIFLPGAVNQCVKTFGTGSSSSLEFINDSEAFGMNDVAPDGSEQYDLSGSYHLNFIIDGSQNDLDTNNYTEVAFTDGLNTIDSMVTAINTALTGTPASKVGTGTSARLEIRGTATTNGNFIKVADGTTTTGALAVMSSQNVPVVDEAGDHVTADEMITTFHPGDLITFTNTPSGTNDTTVRVSNIRGDYRSMTCVPTTPGITNQDCSGTEVTITADARGYFKIFAREYQKIYAQSELSDIGVSTLTYQAYRFPLANSADLKITHDDTAVGTSLPYTDMNITFLEGVGFSAYADATVYPEHSVVQDVGDSSGLGYDGWFYTVAGGTSSGADVDADSGVTWVTFTGEREIGTAYYPFNIIVDADAADDGSLPTAEEIYEFVQYSLRQDADIDAGAGEVVGKVADPLLRFVGDTLVTENGVYIDDFSATDINRLEFYDYNGTKRTFPYVAAGAINFNDNLSQENNAGADAVFAMFFTNNDAGDDDGSDFGTTSAIIVQDNLGANIAGDLTGNISSVQFTYDYNNNVQRGAGSGGTDAPVTVVAIGLNKAQYVKATGIITRSSANAFSLVSSLERNYSNPA